MFFFDKFTYFSQTSSPFYHLFTCFPLVFLLFRKVPGALRTHAATQEQRLFFGDESSDYKGELAVCVAWPGAGRDSVVPPVAPLQQVPGHGGGLGGGAKSQARSRFRTYFG